MRHYVKRRLRQALTRILDPILPLLGRGGRRLATRLVNPKGKLFIPPALGVEGFFAALDADGHRCVVLRWFADLPHVARGHDIDVLVADAAVPGVRALLSTWPRGQKIDYYSESGCAGTGYQPEVLKDVPAFPPGIATHILKNAQPRAGGWFVPAPRDHWLGLAYHATYLKGFASGLPADDATPACKRGSHDYAAILTGLAAEAGIQAPQPVTMERLDRLLATEGWRPRPAHLRALAPANRWISEAP